MNRLEAMSTLLAAVDAGSLSAASRKLAVPLATVSRRVSDLEAALRTKLLVRTSRRLELTDAGEQRRRFEQDQVQRRDLGLAVPPLDECFLAALEAGLPASSGVALGLDRLLMVKIGASHIDQVLAFPIERA